MIAEQFWSRVEKTDSCWLWTGSTNKYGYGLTHRGGPNQATTRRAHRMAWELCNGPIPKGLWVLHKCDNPPCVNPDHLFVGNRSDNMKDAAAKGRNCTVGKSRLTHCKHGHPFSPENTYIRRYGHRGCRACRQKQGREGRTRRRLATEKGEG